MKYQIDSSYLVDCFKRIVSVPSPVGYYIKLNPVLTEIANELNCEVTLQVL